MSDDNCGPSLGRLVKCFLNLNGFQIGAYKIICPFSDQSEMLFQFKIQPELSDSVSKADVASSKSKILGFRTSALAIAIRCF